MIDVNFVNHAGYNVNSLGYRSAEFDTVDWANSYVIQGCSAVFGIGTTDDTRITSYYLSRLLDSPVINLGVPAAGMEVQYLNALEIINNNIKPKGVFIIYPGMDRYTLYTNGTREHVGPWSEEKKLLWMMNNNSRQHNLNLVLGYRTMWKLYGVDLFEWSHHGSNRDFCNEVITWDGFLDFGNDGQHWGAKTSQAVAEILFNQVNKLKAKSIT